MKSKMKISTTNPWHKSDLVKFRHGWIKMTGRIRSLCALKGQEQPSVTFEDVSCHTCSQVADELQSMNSLDTFALGYDQGFKDAMALMQGKN